MDIEDTRLIKSIWPQNAMEYLHRYKSILEVVKGKTVLDMRSGMGMGAYAISQSAKSVLGISENEFELQYAKRNYKCENLTFSDRLWSDTTEKYDVVVCFEDAGKTRTISSIERARAYLNDRGVFVISVPNQMALNSLTEAVEETRECAFAEADLKAVLVKNFEYVQLYYQVVSETSNIINETLMSTDGAVLLSNAKKQKPIGKAYYIAVCSNSPIEEKIKLASSYLPDLEEDYFSKNTTNKAYVYLDCGNGFNNRECVETRYIANNGKFAVYFDLSNFSNIRRVRFDPCEYAAKISIYLVESNIENIRLVPQNAVGQEDDQDIFMTLDPIYKLQVADTEHIEYLRIGGRIEKISNSQLVAYSERLQNGNDKTIRELNRIISGFEVQIADYKKQTSDYERTIAAYKKQIALLEKAIESADNGQLIESLKWQLNRERGIRESIENATFWKITKPLRYISDKVKGVAEKGKSSNKIAIPDEAGVTLSANKTDISQHKDFDKHKWDYDLSVCKDKSPLVSVIVPNFNHEPYLRERLESVYNQTYQNIEVILLDDCSTDNSRSVLNEYAERYKDRTVTDFNETNAGKVFVQWNRGLKHARGKYIWIAESDDYCELNFLETLVPLLEYQSVMIAFARSVFMQDGKKIWSTEEYLNDIDTIDWLHPFMMTAHTAVNLAFARKNIIPNVSSALFRNIGALPDEVVDIWENVKLSGDWLFYLSLIKGGCISYTTETTNYYRIHAASTSTKIQHTADYYKEYEQISEYVAHNYNIDTKVFEQNLDTLKQHYCNMNRCKNADIVETYYRVDYLKEQVKNRKPNILMVCFSMKLGGGETYPLYLANELKRQGYAVSLLDFRMQEYQEEVRSLLNPAVPLFELKNLDRFYNIVLELGGDIIHSHHACTDGAVATWINSTDLNCKHIITLHGMYESIADKDCKDLLKKVSKSCSQFIYIADKNLVPFEKFGYRSKVNLIKMPNGLPQLDVHPISRESMNIEQDAFVLCLVSRGIPEKGWREGIEAVTKARKQCERPLHLVIVGDGEIREELQETSPEYIHFVGTRPNVRDYFMMADLGFLPTYFKGESYPLVLIESLQCGKPVLATDIAEVKNQLTDEQGHLAGELISLNDWKVDVDEIADKIINIVNHPERYAKMKNSVESAARKFSIESITKQYLKIYQQK